MKNITVLLISLILFSFPKRPFFNDAKLSFALVLKFIGIVACKLAIPKLFKCECKTVTSL